MIGLSYNKKGYMTQTNTDNKTDGIQIRNGNSFVVIIVKMIFGINTQEI